VDPVTNQAFVVESGSTASGSASPGQIEIINLGTIKAVQITEVIAPSPIPGPAVIGGIPNALVPQGTLTSAVDLAGVQIFGSGFVAGAQVRLDGAAIPPANVQVVSNRELIATIPASFLTVPHHYALDVVSGGVQSNATDFIVIKAVDMTVACTTGPPQPSSVAIADQLKNGPFSPIAVVSNSGCNNISTIDINPSSATFGTVLNSIPVGTAPQGVAVSAHLGLAVVANNGSGNASIVNLLTNTQPVAAVQVGTNPVGVAISDSTGAALVANFTSNTVSQINLGLLFGSSPATSLTAVTIGGVQAPIAVAIDPDRGTNNQGLAVVTGLQLVSGSTPVGALYPVDIGLASPALSTTVSIGSVTSTPTGITFNPAVSTGTQNPGLFYVNSSGSNLISAFNPDTGSSSSTSVGINPTALAVNPQTGAILTSNFAGQSASIVDTVSSPIKTAQTLGLPGSAQFGVAIDQFTNLAVIVDQANNRVLLFPMPN
jgi:DNA-binding beta-propeller fold protein YncE